jgi:hypothetical protein
VYSGNVNQQGRPEGKGKMTWPDKSFFEGDWRNGSRIGMGHGRIQAPDNSVYEGSLNQDLKPHFKGTKTWFSGEQYTGDWDKGVRQGTGQMKYVNGDCYTGEWSDRVRQGEGKMLYKDGRVEEGQWINDRLYKGEIIDYADGGRYEGGTNEEKKRHG